MTTAVFCEKDPVAMHVKYICHPQTVDVFKEKKEQI